MPFCPGLPKTLECSIDKTYFRRPSATRKQAICSMKKINFSAHHPILDIQGHTVFASNGNVLLCYKASLPEIYSQSETDFDELHASWFQAFKSLPSGTVIHKQDIYRKDHYAADKLPKQSFLQKATYDHF